MISILNSQFFKKLTKFLFSKLILFTVLIISCHQILAQDSSSEVSDIYDCSNYNDFLDSLTLDSLKNWTDTVHKDGVFYFQYDKIKTNQDFQDTIIPILGFDSDYTFVEASSFESRMDENVRFTKYEQKYKGVRVNGGGYTAGRYVPGPGAPDQENCYELFTVSGYFLHDVNISNVSATFTNYSTSLGVDTSDVNSAELVIEFGLDTPCQYGLYWKVNYIDTFSKTAWVDAKSGTVKLTNKTYAYSNKPAKMRDYTGKSVDDQVNGTTRSLIADNLIHNTDAIIRSYDYGYNRSIIPFDPADYTSTFIPVADMSISEWDTEADHDVFQAHYLTDQCVEQFAKTLEIFYGEVYVGANLYHLDSDPQDASIGAVCLKESTTEKTYINFSSNNNETAVQDDIVAHELAHAIINEYLDYRIGDNIGIHEAIADLIANFIESQVTGGSLDYIILDDIDDLDSRDMSEPANDCVSDAISFHRNGEVISSLAWELRTQLEQTEIIDIILDALANIDKEKTSYEQFANAVLTRYAEIYTSCSPTYARLNNFFDGICITTKHNGTLSNTPCKYWIDMPNYVCEEDDSLNICAETQTGIGPFTWRWTIIGDKSTQYQSVYGMVGNKQNGGVCLNLNDFPKYDYYPQYITIQLYTPNLHSKYKVRKRLKLVDCDNDDLTCEEYYDGQGLAPFETVNDFVYPYNSHIGDNAIESVLQYNKDVSNISIYTITGKKLIEYRKHLYTRNFDLSNIVVDNLQQLLIVVFFNKKGEVILRKKIVAVSQ